MSLRVVLDLEIEHLLIELGDTEDALVAALQDREAYRLLAQSAMHKNAELTAQNERLRASVRRSIETTYGAEGRLESERNVA